MEGYKIFKPDWTSSHSDIVFEVGKTYRTAGEPALCSTGLHFCEDVIDCFTYYPLDCRNHVCRVLATGEVDKWRFGDSKVCTNELAILEEVSWEEVFEMISSAHPGFRVVIKTNTGEQNAGNGNDGSNNSGNSNNGDNNSGNGNSGNSNAGDANAGYRNAGSANTGSRNAGNWNVGNFNVGSHNAGNRNIGDWNTGYGNRGCFCTDEHKFILLFDDPTDWSMSDWLHSRARRLLDDLAEQYAEDSGCTSIVAADECYREYAQKWWSALPCADAASILLLPNFNPAKFLEITGIDVYKQVDETGKATKVTGVEECTRSEDVQEDVADTLSVLESIAADLENLL